MYLNNIKERKTTISTFKNLELLDKTTQWFTQNKHIR